MKEQLNSYPYQELLAEIKALIMETIIPHVSDQDCLALWRSVAFIPTRKMNFLTIIAIKSLRELPF